MAEKITGRCMKCKENDREMTDIKVVTTKNNLQMAKGKCKVCDTAMCKILGKKK